MVNLKSIFLPLLGLVFLISCGTEPTPTYQLTTSVVGNGSVNPSSGQFDEGESVTITSTPDSGWVFSNWEGDVNSNSSTNTITITMDSDKNIIGVFSRKSYPLNITIEGEGSVTEKIISQPKATDYPYETVVELAPVASEGWVFVEWTGDVESQESVIEVAITEETNITATFQRKNYPLTISIEGEGTVSERIVSQPKVTDYPYETILELTPNPSEGWIFVEWGGDVISQDTVIELTIKEETNITVRFEEIFFLGENGVTIMCKGAEVGQKGIVNGEVYEAVDRELLLQRRNEGADLTKSCVSNVTDMRWMFSGSQFNGDISNWDVGNVTNMLGMFANSKFNQPIGNWDVSNVTDMGYMFYEIPFNQDIGNWNVSNVTTMQEMFASSEFNQDIGNWDVSNVIDMGYMFYKTPFNQDIGNWDVSNVTTMWGMFNRTPFNQDIGNWDVSNVNTMLGMFNRTPFNQDIGNWNVSNVTDMQTMFYETPFNQDIGNWDVSNVSTMGYMFYKTPFNQDIGNWNVSNVYTMQEMFYETPFNQDLSNWCVSKISSEPTGFSTYAPLTEENKPKWGTCPSN